MWLCVSDRKSRINYEKKLSFSSLNDLIQGQYDNIFKKHKNLYKH